MSLFKERNEQKIVIQLEVHLGPYFAGTYLIMDVLFVHVVFFCFFRLVNNVTFVKERAKQLLCFSGLPSDPPRRVVLTHVLNLRCLFTRLLLDAQRSVATQSTRPS